MASVDIAHRSALEGHATTVSALPDYHRRFQQWVRQGVFKRIVYKLAEDLYKRTVLTSAKHLSTEPSHRQKRGPAVGKTKRGKGTKIWQLQTLLVFLSLLTWKVLRPRSKTG
ncbi:MAG: hypothetical protein HF978_04765 [Desulfobacteraceae bacterium]|nr:hypothetical protein [Desulfobacteraceae bacterium]MBC2754841.1 hypothetical protein [Desulfobacteraceae bacterium]